MEMRSHSITKLASKVEAFSRHIDAWSTQATNAAEREFLGGDPNNGYHAIRQFLLNNGIDTRVFSFGTIALPEAMTEGATANMLASVDNSFFFEFHKLLIPDAGDMPKVNTLVLLVRCFFQDSQNSNTLHVQLVLNHHGDAIFDLNTVYDTIIDMASKDGWALPHSRDASSRITFYEKSYTDLHRFKAFVIQLKAALEAHGTVSHGLSH
jgi:hypothetical protein